MSAWQAWPAADTLKRELQPVAPRCFHENLTATLRASDSYLTYGLDTDAKNGAAARQHIRSRGLSGRVSVEQWSGERLPYAENLVNLLVVSRPSSVAGEE